MSTPGYPRTDVCNDCKGQIFVFLSHRGNEYACNSDNPKDFHEHRYTWQAKTQKQTREEADIEQATVKQKPEPVFHDSHFEQDPEPPKDGFIIEEITATVNRKVGDETIGALAPYENMDFRAELRAEVLRGADVQQVFDALYAEGQKAINRQIRETREKFSK